MKLIIHAPNIHSGGGRTLLLSLINSLWDGLTCILILDQRLHAACQLPENVAIYRVAPSIAGRLRAEKRLRAIAGLHDVVLCFGNLPPLYRLKASVFVFLQNRYLVGSAPLAGFNMATRLRIFIERHWLLTRQRNVDQFIVQTDSMQRAVADRFSPDVVMRPFLETCLNYSRSCDQREDKLPKQYDFLYVASGEPHKHHRQLIGAWVSLASDGIRPSLALTLRKDAYPELCHWIDRVVAEENLNVINLGELGQRNVSDLYRNCHALIHPSTLETIGLPLIEARQAGLPILASELDYVRDVVDPEETFDPHSPVSIARAVKRFLKVPEPPLPLYSPKAFIEEILAGVPRSGASK